MNAIRTPRAMVLTGDGINCEKETAEAFRASGFEVDICHLNDLVREGFSIDQLSKIFSALAIPGGFSFGDDLGSGKLLALKIKYALKWDLAQFSRRGGLVIGVCNGFQALIKLGMFGKEISITRNQSGRFINRWVRVVPAYKKCVWLRGLGNVDMPIRHGEGRVVVRFDSQREVLERLQRNEMDCLRYEKNPNGSTGMIAGLCDPTGRIFGLMPHPEAFVRWSSHPDWNSEPDRAGAPGDGLYLFQNAFEEAKRSQ